MTEELLSKIDIIELNENQNAGTFVVSPLSRGYGQTIGNSLRRVLLSSLEGSCVTRVTFQGVQHEFSTIEGVMEDVPEIILNLKGIASVMHSDGPIDIHLHCKGPMELRAGDLDLDADIEIVNPDHLIATLNEDADFDLDLEFSKGTGYQISELSDLPEPPAQTEGEKEEKKEEEQVIVGAIPVDASFSPVEAVNFTVENTRVGKQTDFDRLEISVETNGTLKAQEALARAASILIDHFRLFVDLPSQEVVNKADHLGTSEEEEKILQTPIDAINLSLRSFNCLKRAGIDTVGDITRRTYNEMFKIKNFGKKSIDEVEKKLAEMGLSFAEGAEDEDTAEDTEV